MTPEASRFLRNAENHLERGLVMLGVHLNDDAARATYLAAFHAAQAIIFDLTGKVAKTHRGVQNEFFQLTRDDPHFTPNERIFLSQAYNFKAVADYDTWSCRPLKRTGNHGSQKRARICCCCPPHVDGPGSRFRFRAVSC